MHCGLQKASSDGKLTRIRRQGYFLRPLARQSSPSPVRRSDGQTKLSKEASITATSTRSPAAAHAT